MTEIRRYKCDRCGAEYEDIRKVKICEQLHKDVDSIADIVYEYPSDKNGGGYPSTMFIKFKDNHKAIYKFMGIYE